MIFLVLLHKTTDRYFVFVVHISRLQEVFVQSGGEIIFRHFNALSIEIYS